MRPWSDQEWPQKYDAAKVEALLKEQGLTMRGTSNGKPDIDDLPPNDPRWLDVQRVVEAVHSGQAVVVSRPPQTPKLGKRSHHKRSA